jgi:hypothetical protein
MAVSRASPACDRSVAVARRVASIFRSQPITHAGGGLHRAAAREHGGAKPPPPPPLPAASRRRRGSATHPDRRRARRVRAPRVRPPARSNARFPRSRCARARPCNPAASKNGFPTAAFFSLPRNIVRSFFPSRVRAPSLVKPRDAGREVPRRGGAHVGAVENLSRSGGKLPALTEKLRQHHGVRKRGARRKVRPVNAARLEPAPAENQAAAGVVQRILSTGAVEPQPRAARRSKFGNVTPRLPSQPKARFRSSTTLKRTSAARGVGAAAAAKRSATCGTQRRIMTAGQRERSRTIPIS